MNEFSATSPRRHWQSRRRGALVGSEHRKLVTKKLRKRIRFLRNEKLQQEANEINMRAQKREIEALFRSFKNDKSSFKAVREKTQCDTGKLKTYFMKHFSSTNSRPTPIELINAPDFVRKLQNICRFQKVFYD